MRGPVVVLMDTVLVVRQPEEAGASRMMHGIREWGMRIRMGRGRAGIMRNRSLGLSRYPGCILSRMLGIQVKREGEVRVVRELGVGVWTRIHSGIKMRRRVCEV